MVFFQKFSHLVAEVAFDFKNEPAHSLFFVAGTISENLLGKRQHSTTGLAAADRSENSHAGEQAPLGNNQPARVLSWLWPPGVMDFSNHQKQLVAAGDLEVRRQL